MMNVYFGLFQKVCLSILDEFYTMIIDQDTITYKGLPLFQRAKMNAPATQQSELQDLACFFYIVNGTLEAVESHGSYRMSSKEALLKRCGNYVSHFQKSDTGEDCEAVAIYFFPDVLHEIYKNEIPAFLKYPAKDVAPQKVVANELIDKYINNLFIYFQNPELIDEELAVLKLKELILILLKSEKYESVHQFLSDIFSPHTLQFKSIIENNLFSNISIEELAFISNKSLSSFKREFKKVYNETPARYVKKMRLEHASGLLISGSESISGIAYESGFVDVTTFSANFQDYFGTSPSNFRLNQKRK